MLNFGSLFAGVGGLDLGLERAGMHCVWQVENHPVRLELLAKRWPLVERYHDVRTWPKKHTIRPDLICGGFPCQDLSYSGKGAGINGDRSRLWFEFERIIRRLQPRYVIVENVPALLRRGIDRVLGGLAASGYDAEWDCLPASAFGAMHERDRIFIVAHNARVYGAASDLLETRDIWAAPLQSRRLHSRDLAAGRKSPGTRLPGEPRVARLVRRLPEAVDRLAGIGNSVFPAVAQWLGERILEHHSRNT